MICPALKKLPFALTFKYFSKQFDYINLIIFFEVFYVEFSPWACSWNSFFFITDNKYHLLVFPPYDCYFIEADFSAEFLEKNLQYDS